MLQLASPADRAAVNALAEQSHQLHIQWRPDIYEMPQELFWEERFLNEIKERKCKARKIFY